MAKESLTKKEQELLRNYSQKGRVFPVGWSALSQESCGEISSVTEGIVNSRSGYLAVCESCGIDIYRQKTIIDRSVDSVKREGDKYRINYNSKAWFLPHMMQGLDFVVFRNLFGDGLFGVLSHGNRIYVETECPSFPDKEFLDAIKNGENIEEKKGSKTYKFEGFVGIGSGAAGITDPEIHSISYPKKSFEISTVIKVEPGKYQCRFIEGNKKLSIRRLRTK